MIYLKRDKIYKLVYDKHRFRTDRRGRNKFRFNKNFGYGFKLNKPYLQYLLQFRICQNADSYFDNKRFSKHQHLGKIFYYHPYS